MIHTFTFTLEENVVYLLDVYLYTNTTAAAAIASRATETLTPIAIFTPLPLPEKVLLYFLKGRTLSLVALYFIQNVRPFHRPQYQVKE